MIDVHCHILPEVDDGSRSLNESIEMALIAQEQGIKKIVNTSHYHPDFRYKKGEELLKELEDFNNVLKENMIDIEVLIGNEIYYTKDLIKENVRVFPIGRLDMNTEGLLLLTNDGEFANKLMHPKNKIEKTYVVKVSRKYNRRKVRKITKWCRYWRLCNKRSKSKATFY